MRFMENAEISLQRIKTWFALISFSGSLVGGPGATAADASATPANQIKAARGFQVELLYSVPKETQGSWVNLAVDGKGRLITSDQNGPLYRITPPPLGGNPGTIKIEEIKLPIGQAQGLLYAFGSLYVVVASEVFQGKGLYRVCDTNGDDRFDEVTLLRRFDKSGSEHGPHAVIPGPDGKSLYVVCGNQTKLTEINGSRVPLRWSEDHLLPRMPDGNGFMAGVLAPGGWICRTDPDGKEWELVATGFRNEFDAAFNHHGQLFTYDADMEWDMNTPWYRPTRVCDVASGAEFGWRNGAGKWPEYYPDSVPPVLNIGPGSPTGLTFGYGARFPAKYQEALFICDWSYGKLYAVHLKPRGASYGGIAEEFITGSPLALTDVVINPVDGAMYFTVGGRKTQSGLYRVTYIGAESTRPARPDDSESSARAIRTKLEAFHGKKDARAIYAAWPHIGSPDRFLRWAARVALEHQDASLWQEKALAERNTQASLTALLALVRVGDKSLKPRVLGSLDRLEWTKLTDSQRADLIRTYGLAFLRMGRPDGPTTARMIQKFDPHFPASTRILNAELCQMLVYLEAPSAASKIMELLEKAPTQEEQMEYARALRVLKTGWTIEERKAYFSWFLKAANYKGGASLAGFLRNMKTDALASLSPAELEAVKPILDRPPLAPGAPGAPMLLAGRTVLKRWTVDELAPLVEKGLKGRSFERGRSLFGAAGCYSCHRFDNEGGAVGPDLTGSGGRFSVRDLLESIVEPSKSISDQYGSVVIALKNGETQMGRIVNLNGENLMVNVNMFDPNNQVAVKRDDVKSMEASKVSMMPEGLLDALLPDEIQDLVAFVLSRGDRKSRYFR
jgi:putative heme-binding domain-containing protein